MRPKTPQLPSGLPVRIAGAADLSEGATLERCRVEAGDFSYASAVGTRWDQVELEKPALVRAELDRGTWFDVRFSHGDLANMQVLEGELLRVVFEQCRMTGFFCGRSNFKEISFSECRMDLVNFRESVLERVLFRKCDLRSADFAGATLSDVRFEECDLAGASYERCTLSDVDLRSSKVAELAGASGLGGSTIDSLQLLDLAPLLSSALKIAVRD